MRRRQSGRCSSKAAAMTEFHNPATATLEEARHVVELIRKSLQHASGEDAADLSYELADWERVVREREADQRRMSRAGSSS